MRFLILLVLTDTAPSTSAHHAPMGSPSHGNGPMASPSHRASIPICSPHTVPATVATMNTPTPGPITAMNLS